MFQPMEFFVNNEPDFQFWVVKEFIFEEQDIIFLNQLDLQERPLNNDVFDDRIAINENRVTVEQMNQDLINRIQGFGEIGTNVSEFIRNFSEVAEDNMRNWPTSWNDIKFFSNRLINASFSFIQVLIRMNREATRIPFEQTTRLVEINLQSMTINEQITNHFSQILTRVFETNEQNRTAIAKLYLNFYDMIDTIFEKMQNSSNTLFKMNQEDFSHIMEIRNFLMFFEKKLAIQQKDLHDFSIKETQALVYSDLKETIIVTDERNIQMESR
jgi:hypothetical protein